MPQFILFYHGGKMPESPEEGKKNKEKFKGDDDGLIRQSIEDAFLEVEEEFLGIARTSYQYGNIIET